MMYPTLLGKGNSCGGTLVHILCISEGLLWSPRTYLAENYSSGNLKQKPLDSHIEISAMIEKLELSPYYNV